MMMMMKAIKMMRMRMMMLMIMMMIMVIMMMVMMMTLQFLDKPRLRTVKAKKSRRNTPATAVAAADGCSASNLKPMLCSSGSVLGSYAYLTKSTL